MKSWFFLLCVALNIYYLWFGMTKQAFPLRGGGVFPKTKDPLLFQFMLWSTVVSLIAFTVLFVLSFFIVF